MVSKTRKQLQKRKAKVEANEGVLPQVIPSKKKSVQLKNTRPNMKRKLKWRLGLESADIYEGFEDKKGVLWKCPTCGLMCRVVGFCLQCTTGKKAKQHVGMNMSREESFRAGAAADSLSRPKKTTAKKAAPLASAKDAKKSKLKFKKKR